MTSDYFFEGADFENKKFKALMPEFYPAVYQEYIREETELLKSKVSGSNRILEAGVGIGRLIPVLAPIVKEMIGIDKADLMVKLSSEVAKKFQNVKIMKIDFEELSKTFPENYFDYGLCVWNTLGNTKNEAEVLRELSKVISGSIFITVYLKGTLNQRKDWYKTVGIKIKEIDEENEIFYSESGLRSKSYSVKDIKIFAGSTGLKFINSQVLSGVMLWAELAK